MKKLCTILLTLALTLSLSAPALALHEGEIGICLDGDTYYPTDLPVQVQNGRTMVPIRDLAEKLGADVEWVQESQQIVMTRAGSTVTMTLGETAAVGDSDNDLSMLRAAGLPIAMGNAPAAVREAARRTAPSNQEEGVAWAISRCLEENEWERGEKG